MINLLPPIEKERILSNFKKRLIIILWILVLFFIFCLVFVLLSVKFYIMEEFESQKIFFEEAEEKFKNSGAQELQKEISLVNVKLERLDDFYRNKIYIVEILEKISNILPQGIYLIDFSSSLLKEKSESGLKISISGFARDREVLFNFKENLEKDDSFKEVYFPPANWVKPNNIDFVVSFKTNH